MACPRVSNVLLVMLNPVAVAASDVLDYTSVYDLKLLFEYSVALFLIQYLCFVNTLRMLALCWMQTLPHAAVFATGLVEKSSQSGRGLDGAATADVGCVLKMLVLAVSFAEPDASAQDVVMAAILGLVRDICWLLMCREFQDPLQMAHLVERWLVNLGEPVWGVCASASARPGWRRVYFDK